MKKFIALLLVFVMLLSLAGCGKATTTSEGSSGKKLGTLQKVLSGKKIVVGAILSFPPFGFKDQNGTPQGYDVDLAHELAKSLGVEIEFVEVTADARVSSLETGKVDVIFGNFTRTLERAQKVNFSDPYVVAGERLLVKKGSGIKSVEDLTGKKVAVTKGSTNAELMAELNPNAEVVFFETSAEALTAVKNGQAATFLEDSNFQQYQAAQNEDLEVVGDSLISLEYNCIGAAKGDQDWLNYLNYFVFDVNKSGKNDELYRKWFGESLPFSLTPQF
jgi:polar amino acid transport system substrate-binding protein